MNPVETIVEIYTLKMQETGRPENEGQIEYAKL